MNNFISIFSDGGARGNPGIAASAFVVYQKNKIIYQDAKYIGKTTNNQAEYSAALMAVDWLGKNTKVVNSQKIKHFMDSELVVKQLRGDYKIKNRDLKKYYEKIKKLIEKHGISIDFVHINRNKNKRADFLVNKILDDLVSR